MNENVWFSSHFEESKEKRAKACMKTQDHRHTKKHNKPGVFGTCSKSEPAKTIKKMHGSAALRLEKRVKTRGFRNICEKANKKRANLGLIQKS